MVVLYKKTNYIMAKCSLKTKVTVMFLDATRNSRTATTTIPIGSYFTKKIDANYANNYLVALGV